MIKFLQGYLGNGEFTPEPRRQSLPIPIFIRILLLFSLLFYTGCSSKVKRIDNSSTELTTIRWDTNDLQEMAQKMVTNILSSSNISFSKEKVYSFGKITNDSHDHIDTKQLANKILTALVQSKKMTLSTNKNDQSSGIFFGKISSIFKKNSNTKDMFFFFNLTLTDRQTSAVIWSHDVEIRKTYKKALFGF